MKNYFAEEIKNIEAEILALKTSSEYSSVRSANYTSSANVYTGLYKVTYGAGDERIFSMIYCGDTIRGFMYGRTPTGNTQIIEAYTTYIDFDTQTPQTDYVPISIISNRPVVSIERL